MTREQYLNVVDFHLRDLPWRARKNLAADLRIHLNEIPAEDLETRLGSPSTYAAEMRAAAGLAPRRGPVAFLRARRPRNLVFIAIMLGVLGASIGGVVWGRSYQPLGAGSTGLSPNPSTDGALNETVARFRDGKPFQYGFSMRNNGRFAVRVLDIPLRGFTQPFAVRVFVDPSELGTGLIQQPFHPFTLRPGHERFILLRGQYANCDQYVANAATIFYAMPVRTRFLLWTRTVELPLSYPLVIKMPTHNPCR